MRSRIVIQLFTVSLVFIVTTFSFMPAPVAASPSISLPGFEKFVSKVTDGQAGVIRGVYVPDVLAWRVRSQPVGQPSYVSSASDAVTQFQLAADLGITGFLAHNYLAGKSFFNLAIGDEVRVIYGDGLVKNYIISDIYRYQALEPASPYSDLIDLSNNVQVSMSDVFNKIYAGEDHVAFQTCIAKGRNLAWGRFFAVAYPEP